MARVLRKTKVVATIGPACDSVDVLRQMIQAGMNVARLNFSHGNHEEHRARLERVRQASRELSANVAIMLDTKGLEIRTGAIGGERPELAVGDPFTLFLDDRLGGPEGVSISYPSLAHEVRLGSPILIDDGRIELRIVALRDDSIECEVVRGGELGSRKGVNVPDTSLSQRSAGSENTDDLLFAVHNEIDYIAASWVRSAADVAEIRKIVSNAGAEIPIIAKIENKEAVENLAEIVSVADGTMVARGDLGVELPVQEVPLAQKEIIRRTVMNGKPVITATQMLDSMERNPRPTRAEASDVANAILDGTSAVMLSGETAAGRYPVESVRTMSALALRAEAALQQYGDLQQIQPDVKNVVVTDAVAQAAITLAHHLKAAAILTLTESGFTARSISKFRPDCPNIAVSSHAPVVRKLALNWGVTAVLYDGDGADAERIEFGIEKARQQGFLEDGDVVVATAGTSRETGTTNLIRVVTVGEDLVS